MAELNCSQLLRTTCSVATPGDLVSDAVQTLLEASNRRVYVVGDDRQLLGLVPDYELLKCLLGGRPGAALDSILSRHIETALASTPISDVAPLFRESRHSELPIVDDDTKAFLGVLSRNDMLRAVNAERLGEPVTVPEMTIPESPPHEDTTTGQHAQWLNLQFSRVRIDLARTGESLQEMPHFADANATPCDAAGSSDSRRR